MTGSPLRTVLTALDGGSTSRAGIVASTGLDRDTVDAAIEHLVRLGRVEASVLSTGCPGGGCGSCASGHDDGAPGCGSSGPSAARTGPVLVQLSVRRA